MHKFGVCFQFWLVSLIKDRNVHIMDMGISWEINLLY